MPEKRAKESKLAKAIAEAVVGENNEKEWDENFDDDTKAKVSGYNENGEENNESDDDDDWKLDFETTPAATTLSQRSTLRTQNAPEFGSFADDDRYKGKKVSRKTADISRLDESNETSTIDEKEQAAAELGYLLEGGSEEDSDEETDEDTAFTGAEKELINAGVENGNDSYNLGNEIDYGSFGGMSEDEGTEDEESEDEGDVSDEEERPNNKNEEPSIKITGNDKSNEYQKGLAIKSQMIVWDRLLEYRIQVQKILQNINKFPQHDSWPSFVEDIQAQESSKNGDIVKNDTIKKCQSSIMNLLELLISTKTKLIENNPEIKRAYSSHENSQDDSNDQVPRKKRKIADYER